MLQAGPSIPALAVAIVAGVTRLAHSPHSQLAHRLGRRRRRRSQHHPLSPAGFEDFPARPGLGFGSSLISLCPRPQPRRRRLELAGSLGACLGPHPLLAVLIGAILVAGIMALVLVILKGRLKQTLRNLAHLLASILSLRMPGPEVSLDIPPPPRSPSESPWPPPFCFTSSAHRGRGFPFERKQNLIDLVHAACSPHLADENNYRARVTSRGRMTQ